MPTRLVAGDIGGTKTLLQCIDSAGGVVREERYDSDAWATFDDVLRDFFRGVEGPIDAACFAVAGPVFGGKATVTNVGWMMEESALARTFSIGRVSLINDFYAVALGVPLLEPKDVLSLQEGTRHRKAPTAVIGAGTGLGEALIVHGRGAYHVVPGEGGHADFAPQDEEQARLFLHLQQIYGHVSWERVVCGAGLVNIFTFLGGEEITPAQVAARADDGDALAMRAFAMFVDAYGAEAGNFALRNLTHGGVYLAGGIAAKNVRWFTDGKFLEAFRRKGRFAHVLETVPVDLIVDERVGLLGAMEGARRTLLDER